MSDKIAYINHDIDDAIRGLILTEDDIPKELRNTLGHSSRERLDNLIHDVIMSSLHNIDVMDKECRNDLEPIAMSAEMEQAMYDLRKFMFSNVYQNPVAKAEEIKAQRMLSQLFEYYIEHMDQLPMKYVRMIEQGKEAKDRVVCDYIAGMTDQYAVTKFNEFFMPVSWQVDGY